jgi:hypothetical protein
VLLILHLVDHQRMLCDFGQWIFDVLRSSFRFGDHELQPSIATTLFVVANGANNL